MFTACSSQLYAGGHVSADRARPAAAAPARTARGATIERVAYFDAASTEPLHPAGPRGADRGPRRRLGRPARLYGAARRARMLLEQARAEVAEAARRPARRGLLHLLRHAGGAPGRARHAARPAPGRPAPGALARSSTPACCTPPGSHERDGGIGRDGRRRPLRARSTWRSSAGGRSPAGTALACLQSANHEVGTLQPVAEVAAACAGRRRAAARGRRAVRRAGCRPGGLVGADASAHKWGGPAGVGVLVVRKGTRWRSPLPEDERERRRVPGFENVPAIVAAAAALRAVVGRVGHESARLSALVDRIRTEVPRLVPDVEVIGDPVDAAAPHGHVLVPVRRRRGAADRARPAGFAVSSGSSCTASTLRPSHVLEAMGVLTHGNVRVSLPRGTSDDDVDRFLAVLPGMVGGSARTRE